MIYLYLFFFVYLASGLILLVKGRKEAAIKMMEILMFILFPISLILSLLFMYINYWEILTLGHKLLFVFIPIAVSAMIIYIKIVNRRRARLLKQ